MQFFTAPYNLPFTIALAVVFLLGLIETASLLLGGGGGMAELDAPEIGDVGGLDGADGVDAPEVGQGGGMTHLFSWLHVGVIPTTILLLLFLMCFGLSGLVLQWLLVTRLGAPLPATIASLPALALALMGTRVTGCVLKPLMPRDETEAVSRDSFVGCGGQITVGAARRGQPAEARVKDRFGHTHYVMVEPEGAEVFPAGAQVLLLKRHGHLYRVIDNSGAEL